MKTVVDPRQLARLCPLLAHQAWNKEYLAALSRTTLTESSRTYQMDKIIWLASTRMDSLRHIRVNHSRTKEEMSPPRKIGRMYKAALWICSKIKMEDQIRN